MQMKLTRQSFTRGRGRLAAAAASLAVVLAVVVVALVAGAARLTDLSALADARSAAPQGTVATAVPPTGRGTPPATSTTPLASHPGPRRTGATTPSTGTREPGGQASPPVRTSPAAASRSRPPPKAPANAAPQPVDPSQLFTTGPFRSKVSSWPVDPSSPAYIARLGALDLVVSLRQWTVAVYGAGPDTTLTDVALTQTWGSGVTSLDGVPMPAGVRPDPAADGHLSVVQASSGCVYDLFRARSSEGSWTAASGNATSQGSTGIYAGGGGTRAAGFSAALGLVWPQELAGGHIDHALVFAYPYTRSGAPVPPATRSDGRSTTTGALPMGARLRLDPALDLSRLGLSPTELTIARALQQYGMVLGDTSGGFTLYAPHPRGLGYDPYPRLFGTTSDWAYLGKLPMDRLQVLTLPGPASSRGSESSCAHLR